MRQGRMVLSVFDKPIEQGKTDMSNVFADFLVNKGLYDTIAITKENVKDLVSLIGGKVKISVFCPQCGELRVFKSEPIVYYEEDGKNQLVVPVALAERLALLHSKSVGVLVKNDDGTTEQVWCWNGLLCQEHTRMIAFHFTCAMDESHHLDYIVTTDDSKMRKIGQFPSIADMAKPELKEYQKLLTKADMNELRRAVGLHAQGIGVGSYVYLRRVFERIIDQAKETAINEGKIDAEGFAIAHVNERVKMLRDYLPPMLTSSSAFYSIVSKGIHELSEENCIDYFPVLFDAIMLILKQWETARQEKAAEARLSAELSKIATEIK